MTQRRARKQERIEPPVIAGRVPPCNLDAEAAVLSAILLDPGALDKVTEFLKCEHFYSEANGRVYEAATELSLAGTPIDIISVAAWLRDRGRIAQVGGASYLAQITDATPAVANVATHARIVVDHWRVRQTIATCQRVSAEGYGDVGEAQSFIDQALAALEDIRSGSVTKATEPEHVCDIARETFTKLQVHADAGGGMLGKSTGFSRLDNKTSGLHDGDVLVIAARPGMGKSASALNIAVNVAAPTPVTNEYGAETGDCIMGEGVFIASLEMPKAQLLLRILCSEARVDLGKIRAGKLQKADWDALTDAAGFVSKLPIWIDDTPAISLATLRAKAKSVAGQCERAGTKLGLIVVDYVQLLSGNGTETSREQEVANCSKGMKTLAKELACPVIVLSQLNRDVEKRGKKGRPQLSDLRESGSVEQDADTIMFIHNEDVANQSEIKSGIAEWIIAKQRNGPTGKIYMGFDGYCTRFRELKPDEYPRENNDE